MFESDLVSTAASVVAGLAMAIVLLGDGAWERLPARARRAYQALLVFGVAALLLFLLALAVERINGETEWDFLVFWLTGQVAARGGDVYDPAAFRTVPLPFEVSPEFESEVLDNGSFYPPVTLPLFLPLGWFPYRPAYVVWTLVNGAALLFCVPLLARRLAGAGPATRRTAAIAAALILLMPASASLVRHGQTGFLLLLAVLLVQAQAAPDWRRGVALGAGVAVKPLLAVLALPFLVRRRGGVLLAAVALLAGLAALAALAFSGEVFAAFGRRTYVYPSWIYFESMNQSLLAYLLRIAGARPAAPVWYPPFVVAAAIIAGTLLGHLVRARRDPEALRDHLDLALLSALLVYPGTLKHYSVLLCAPAAGLWARRPTPAGAGSALLLGAAYALAGAADGRFAMFGTLLVLGACWRRAWRARAIG